MSDGIKKIGVLTSGGDAPGMNAAVRAVAKNAISKGIEVIGIRKGYAGLINDDMMPLTIRDLSGKIQKGGTFLYTARSEEFKTSEGLKTAFENYSKHQLDGLVIIGGDGSFKGARDFVKEGARVIGIPGTIDLDVACSEYTIGFDTAVNTAMEAIDKLKDTSTSHEKCSIVEVMGRNAGYIALWCAIANGAEDFIIPEKASDFSEEKLMESIKRSKAMGKTHHIVINAEGIGHSYGMAKRIEAATGISTRATILGHVQRGGSPSAKDRVYASIMGAMAVDLLCDGEYNKIIGYKQGVFRAFDIDAALAMQKSINEYHYDIATMLGR